MPLQSETKVILAAIALVFALCFASTRLPAHDWYPLGCCGNKDCAPASVTAVPKSGTFLVTTRYGQVEVPQTFPVLPAPDGVVEPHACIGKSVDGQDRLLCLWLPPGT